MLSVRGSYKDGTIVLKECIKTTKPVDVIVTFMEDVDKPAAVRIDVRGFSFDKTKNLLKSYKGSLSEAVIAERRSAV